MKRMIVLTLTFLFLASMIVVNVYAAEEATANPVTARYYVDEHIPAGTTIKDKTQVDSIEGLIEAGTGWDGTWYKDWGKTPVSGGNFHLRTSGGSNDTNGLYFGLGATTQYTRKLLSPINAAADGVYYIRATMVNKQSSAHGTYDVKSYFSLVNSKNTNNKEVVKVSIDYFTGASAPTMTVNDVATNAVLTADYSYDILIKLVVNADDMDKLCVEWVGKDADFTGNWNYETLFDLGENTLDFVSFGCSGLATMRFKNVEIESYNNATTLLDEAKQVENIVASANYKNYRECINQIKSLNLPNGKLKATAVGEILKNANVIAYDYLEFDNIKNLPNQRVSFKEDAAYRQGGYGWRSDWTTATKYSDNTVPADSRMIRYYEKPDKNLITCTAAGGYVRRWFNAPRDDGQDKRYTFGFTMGLMGGTVFNSNGAAIEGQIAIGTGNYAAANNKITVGMKGYKAGTHPTLGTAQTEDRIYPYITVGDTTLVGDKYVSNDGGVVYRYLVDVTMDADGNDTVRLRVAHNGAALADTVCDLTVTNCEVGNTLSYFNYSTITYGVTAVGEIEIYQNKDMLSADTAEFYNGNDKISDKSTLTNSVTVKTSIDNTFNGNKDVTLYVAIYKDDLMLKASFQPVTALANQITPVTLHFTAPDGIELSQCDIKAFVWDDELKPLIVGVGL